MTLCLTRRRLRLYYSSPVRNCVRQLWAAPPAVRGAQQVLHWQWNCIPAADQAREFEDDFGNRVLEIRHHQIERDWEFSLELSTQRDSLAAPRDSNLPPQGIGAFLLPSARCDLTPEILAAAQQLRSTVDFRVPIEGEAKERADTCADICAWAHSALRYDAQARGELWTASQALARGAGVCADYAHLMIAICRVLHIPARYVAGYNPTEGAMHAWCEVLIGETWRAYDPTHGRLARPDCVFVAAGRDERDCPPLRGTFAGHARVRMDSWCQTEVLGAA